MAVFGGAPIRTQQAQLRQGGQVVVGTVGRVLDLISRHSLMLHSCRYIVLDEADEMLDLGFLEDVEKILSLAPGSRQTALFSATMPTEIRQLAERHLYDPVTVQVKAATLTIDTVEQFYVETKPQEKVDTLARVLESERPQQAIVFTRTKIRCEQLFRTLENQGMNVKALHGDMSQGSRDGVMINFKGGRTTILGRHRRRRPRPRHLDGHAHRQLRRADLARRLRAPDRPHGPRRALRPRDHVRRAAPAARPGGDRAPRVDEHRAVGRGRARRADAAPPSRARAATASRTTRPTTNGGGYAKLIANAGRHEGVEAADLIAAMAAGGLDGEAIRNVRVLERFALVEVPADAVPDRRGHEVRGRTVALEPIRN